MNADQNKRYIGIVKWFHDENKDADYGFIQHPALGDIYFNSRSIVKGTPVFEFKEGKVVTFRLGIARYREKTAPAVEVNLLSRDHDLPFLLAEHVTLLFSRGTQMVLAIIVALNDRIGELIAALKDQKERLEIHQQFLQLIIPALQGTELTISKLRGLLPIESAWFKNQPSLLYDYLADKISEEYKYTLWLEGLWKMCPIGYVAEQIFKETDGSLPAIFAKTTAEEKSNILYGFIFKLEHEAFDLTKTIRYLRILKKHAPELYDQLLKEVIKFSPGYFHINLWLNNFTDDLHFDDFKLYVPTLTTVDQKRFVKKVLRYIHDKKANITVKQLTELNTIDYETSKAAGKIDNSHLDYSTSIILNVLAELSGDKKIDSRKEEKAAQLKMYDIILRQIQSPNDILEITGFFDACEGRCIVTSQMGHDGEGSEKISYSKERKADYKPHPICEGRHAINHTTGVPALSEEGLEFWWCANQKCYNPSRKLHASTEWENYSLLDFLTILKIPFREKDFEIYLNLINKANRFLSHLKCRSCNHILRPSGKSNYAFYGVNLFHCDNEQCTENKDIYITHCLNGYCEETIDSRDSVKCIPDGRDPKVCGWYICNTCLACCSTDRLNKRKYAMEITGQEYKCHHEGHKDLGLICCNKCGSPFNSNEINHEEYLVMLNWFKSLSEGSEYLHRKGQNRNGKWWFLFKMGRLTIETYRDKLKKLLMAGFVIPDYTDQYKNMQLVAESNNPNYTSSNLLMCSNPHCNHIIDLSSDPQRAFRIKKFHTVRFPDYKKV